MEVRFAQGELAPYSAYLLFLGTINNENPIFESQITLSPAVFTVYGCSTSFEACDTLIELCRQNGVLYQSTLCGTLSLCLGER